jgi:hypothetical protein
MIADPEGPSFITRTVGHRRYADGASVTHDPERTLPTLLAPSRAVLWERNSTETRTAILPPRAGVTARCADG